MQYTDNTKGSNLKFSNVENRPNKTAKGFTKHYENWATKGRSHISNDKHPNFNKRGTFHEILSLITRGTTDELRGLSFTIKKKVLKEHPTEKGYFKEVYVLTDFGKRKLKNLKQNKCNASDLCNPIIKFGSLECGNCDL